MSGNRAHVFQKINLEIHYVDTSTPLTETEIVADNSVFVEREVGCVILNNIIQLKKNVFIVK